jgi:hypothetical protein
MGQLVNEVYSHGADYEVRICLNTGLFKKKYRLSKMYFASTVEHMATCYI